MESSAVGWTWGVVAMVVAFAWVLTEKLVRRVVGPRLARALMARGQAGLAAKVLRALYLGHEQDYWLGFRLAQALFMAGEPRRALMLADELVPGAPLELQGPVQGLRAACHERLGAGKEAAVARAEAESAYRAQQPASLWAAEMEVDALILAGDWAAALIELESILDAAVAQPAPTGDPTSWASWLASLRVRLAELYVGLGHYRAAVTALELVLGRAGTPETLRHRAHLAAARAYLALDNLEQAERDARDAFRLANLARDPQRLVDDCLLLGDLALRRGSFTEAMAQYQRVRECGPEGRWLAFLAETEALALHGRHAAADQAGARAAELVVGDPQRTAQVAHLRALWRYDRDPAAAHALLAPTLGTPLPDPRATVQRAALAATCEAATGGDPEPWLEQVAAARREWAHDHRLLAQLDAAEAELAWLAGDDLRAAELLEAALARPADPLDVARLELRRAAVAVRLGQAEEPWLRRAAGGALPLEATEQARARLTV